jgi:hypothetical protein
MRQLQKGIVIVSRLATQQSVRSYEMLVETIRLNTSKLERRCDQVRALYSDTIASIETT